MRLDQKWGVVQQLKVEADTYDALFGAMTVAAVYNKKATHFSIDKGSLTLEWASGGMFSRPLAFPLEGPKEMADFVRLWLEKSASWDGLDIPDTDGSVHKGFRIEHGYHYTVVKVTPVYIIYGK